MEKGNRRTVEEVTGALLGQQEIIESLVSHNRHLISLLAQYTEVEAEEMRLSVCLGDGTKENL